MIKKILPLIIMPICGIALASLISSQRQDLFEYSLLPNSGFENGTAKWNNNGSGILSVVENDVAYGRASLSYDGVGNGDNLESDLFNIDKFAQGVDCEMTFYYKGGDALSTMQVLDESDVVVASLVLEPQAEFASKKIEFTCGDQHKVKLLSTGDSAELKLDGIFFGKKFNFGVNDDFFTGFKNFVVGIFDQELDVKNANKIDSSYTISYGIERIPFRGISKTNEYDDQGMPLWELSDRKDNRIRFGGSQIKMTTGSQGNSLFVASTSDDHYMDVKFYGTGLNILTRLHASTIKADVYVDGELYQKDVFKFYTNAGDTVIGGRNYNQNATVNLVSNLELGWHTVRFQEVADTPVLYGIEILGGREVPSDSVELLTNNDFSNGVTGYTTFQSGTGSVNIQKGLARFNNTSSGGVVLAQTVNTIKDEYYLAKYDLSYGSYANAFLAMYDGVQVAVGTPTQPRLLNSDGSKGYVIFKALSDQTSMLMSYLGAGGGEFGISSLSIKKLAGYTLGSELITNGTFDTDISGWIEYISGSGSTSVSGGQLTLNTASGGGNNYGAVYQQVVTEKGKFYRYEFDCLAGCTNSRVIARDSDWVSGPTLYDNFQQNTNTSSVGTHSIIFRAQSDISFISLWVEFANGTNVTYDNASLKEITYDDLPMTLAVGNGVANGKLIATQEITTDYKAGVSGTKGARVVKYVGTDGAISQAVQEVKSVRTLKYNSDGVDLTNDIDMDDVSAWSVNSESSFSKVDGGIRLSTATTGVSYIYQPVSMVEGELYVVRAGVFNKTGSRPVYMRMFSADPINRATGIANIVTENDYVFVPVGTDQEALGTYAEHIMVAPSTGTFYLAVLHDANAGDTVDINHFSVQKAEYGSNLVENGTFDTGLDGWIVSATSGNTIWNAGKARFTYNTGGNSGFIQIFKTTKGRKYKIIANAQNISGDASTFFSVSSGKNGSYSSHFAAGTIASGQISDGNNHLEFTALDDYSTLLFNGSTGTTVTTDFDNVYIYELDTDIHKDEELTRSIHFREFGANRGDDFMTLSSSARDNVFTLNDGTTNLSCNDCRIVEESLFMDNGTQYYATFTFVGTGLSIFYENNQSTFDKGIDQLTVDGNLIDITDNRMIMKGSQDGILPIVSNLPYGTHTVLFRSNTTYNIIINRFLVYGPKKPSIPESTVELADYNVMADYRSGATSTSWALFANFNYYNVSQGTLRKQASREMMYGSGSSLPNPTFPTSPSGSIYQIGTGGVEYEFFGTGVTLLTHGKSSGAGNLKVEINDQAYNDGYMPITKSVPTNGIYPCSNSQDCTIEISNLPMGHHKIKVSNVSGNTYFHGFEVHTPIHVPDIHNGSMALDRNLARTPMVEQPERDNNISFVYDATNDLIQKSKGVFRVNELSSTDIQFTFDKNCKSFVGTAITGHNGNYSLRSFAQLGTDVLQNTTDMVGTGARVVIPTASTTVFLDGHCKMD